MVDAFDYIYSPVTGKKVSIHSSEGKRTLKGFIMEQRGGSLSNVVKKVSQGAKRVVKGAKVAVGLKKRVGRPSSGPKKNKRKMRTVVKNTMGSKSSPRSPACPKECKNKKPTSGNKKPTTLGGIVRTQMGADRVSPVPRSCPKNKNC